MQDIRPTECQRLVFAEDIRVFKRKYHRPDVSGGSCKPFHKAGLPKVQNQVNATA